MTTTKKMLGYFLFALSTIARAASTNDLANLVAPPELVATRICATFGEQIFAPQVVEGIRRRGVSQRLSTEELRSIVEKFDGAMVSFCKGVTIAAKGKKTEITGLFEKYYAIPLERDWARFLEDPASRAWAKNNAAFYVQVWPLISIYALLKRIAPESLGTQLRVPSVLNFTYIQDRELLDKYTRTATGTSDFVYRRMITLLLNDPGFSSIAPKRYGLKQLAALDVELLNRGSQVTNPGPLFSSLESTFVRVDSSAQELLAPALRQSELTTQKAIADVLQ